MEYKAICRQVLIPMTAMCRPFKFVTESRHIKNVE